MITNIVRNIEWLSANSGRHYPLTAEAHGRSQDGSFTLPEDFIVSLYLFVPFSTAVDTSKFFIRKVLAKPATGYTLTVGYQSDSGPIDIATAQIQKINHTQFKSYRLGGLGDFHSAWGTVVIGSLETIEREPAGEFLFDFESTRLETDAVRPLLRTIPHIRVRNGVDLSPPLYGPILFQAGANCRFGIYYSLGYPAVSINAVDNTGMTDTCPDSLPDRPIRSINGISPNEEGDLVIEGSECVRIRPSGRGLRIENVCAKPVCGSSELELLTREAELINQRLATLDSFLRRLEVEVDTMYNSFLSSQLGAGGCLDYSGE